MLRARHASPDALELRPLTGLPSIKISVPDGKISNRRLTSHADHWWRCWSVKLHAWHAMISDTYRDAGNRFADSICGDVKPAVTCSSAQRNDNDVQYRRRKPGSIVGSCLYPIIEQGVVKAGMNLLVHRFYSCILPQVELQLSGMVILILTHPPPKTRSQDCAVQLVIDNVHGFHGAPCRYCKCKCLSMSYQYLRFHNQ